MFPTGESDDDRRLNKAADRDVYRGCESKSWRSYDLPPALLTYWAVDQAQGIIDNGGFQYFFENDWPEKPDYKIFVEAYRKIGAKEAAGCLEDAVSQFRFSNPHLDREQRREFLESSRSGPGKYDSIIDLLGDRVIDLSGDTYIRLAAFVRANREAFPAAKKFLSAGNL